MDMMHINPAEYRKMAEMCRRHAESLRNDLDRARWLRIAEGWAVIARDATRANIVTAKAKAVLSDIKHPQDGLRSANGG